MKWLAPVALVLLTTSGSAAPASRRNRMFRMARHCVALFQNGWDNDPRAPSPEFWHGAGSPARFRAARRVMNTMSRRALRHTLHAMLLELPDRSAARQGVAYVAAIKGFDVLANLDRVAAHGGLRRSHTIWGHPDVGGLAEDTFDRVYDIYRHQPSAAARRYILRLRSDGAGETTLMGVRLCMLHRDPEAVLQTIAADPESLRRMRDTMEDESGPEEKRLLKRYRHSRNVHVRRAAWLCLRSISDAENWRRSR